jgi:hypothetical protein
MIVKILFQLLHSLIQFRNYLVMIYQTITSTLDLLPITFLKTSIRPRVQINLVHVKFCKKDVKMIILAKN